MTEQKLTTILRLSCIFICSAMLTWMFLEIAESCSRDSAREKRANQLLAEMEQIVAESRAALGAPAPGKPVVSGGRQLPVREWPTANITVFASADTAYIRFVDPPEALARRIGRGELKARLRAASARAAAAADSETGVIHMKHVGEYCWRCRKNLRGRHTVWCTVPKAPGEGTVAHYDLVSLPFCSVACGDALRAKREAAKKEANR